MRRARVKVAPNLGPKLGRNAAPAPAKVSEDAAVKSVTSPAAKASGAEAEKPTTPTVGSSVRESLRLGIEQRSRRDSAAGSQTKDVGSPPPTASNPDFINLRSPPAKTVTASPPAKLLPEIKSPKKPGTGSELSKKLLNTESGTSEPTTESTSSTRVKTRDETDGAKAADAKPSEPAKPSLNRRSRFLKAKPNIVESNRNRGRLSSVSESTPVESINNRARLNSVSDVEGETVKKPAVVSPKPVVVPVTLPKFKELTESELPPKKALQEADDINKEKESTKTIQTKEKTTEKKVRKRTKKEILDGPDSKKQTRKFVNLYEPIDRAKLTIRDLIYMNPVSNPMKKKKDAEKPKTKPEDVKDAKDKEKVGEGTNNEDETDNASQQAEKQGDDQENATDATVIDDDNAEEDEAMPVPQVTIGEDGQIILNEQSLVIANPKNKENIQDMEIVHESESTGKWGYGKTYKCRTWTLSETKKFYLALSTVGTDFTLMAKVFPSRTRVELKRKFKREEQVNKFLIDEAVKERMKFDEDFMDELIALDKADTEERERIAKEKEERKNKKKQKAEDGGEKEKKAPAEKKPRKPRKRKAKPPVEDKEDALDMVDIETTGQENSAEGAAANPSAEKLPKKTQGTKMKRKARGVRGKKARAKKAKLMYDDSDEEDEDPNLFFITPDPDTEVEITDQTQDCSDKMVEEDSSQPFIPKPPEHEDGTEVSEFLIRLHSKPTRSGRTVRTPKVLLEEEGSEEEEVVRKSKRSGKTVIVSDGEDSEIAEEEIITGMTPGRQREVEMNGKNSEESNDSMGAEPSKAVDASNDGAATVAIGADVSKPEKGDLNVVKSLRGPIKKVEARSELGSENQTGISLAKVLAASVGATAEHVSFVTASETVGDKEDDAGPYIVVEVLDTEDDASNDSATVETKDDGTIKRTGDGSKNIDKNRHDIGGETVAQIVQEKGTNSNTQCSESNDKHVVDAHSSGTTVCLPEGSKSQLTTNGCRVTRTDNSTAVSSIDSNAWESRESNVGEKVMGTDVAVENEIDESEMTAFVDDSDVEMMDDEENDDEDVEDAEAKMEEDDAELETSFEVQDANDDSVIVVSAANPPKTSEDHLTNSGPSSINPPIAAVSGNSSTSGFEPGSLVFVTSDPTIDENGVEVPGAIHVYLVSESGDLDNNVVNLGSMPGDSGNSSEDLARLLQSASSNIMGLGNSNPTSNNSNVATDSSDNDNGMKT